MTLFCIFVTLKIDWNSYSFVCLFIASWLEHFMKQSLSVLLTPVSPAPNIGTNAEKVLIKYLLNIWVRSSHHILSFLHFHHSHSVSSFLFCHDCSQCCSIQYELKMWAPCVILNSLIVILKSYYEHINFLIIYLSQ